MPDLPSQKKTKQRLLPILAGFYALLMFLLLSNQSLPYPLNDPDFRAVYNAWKIPGARVSDSWLAEGMDRCLAQLFPEQMLPLMQLSRRLAITMAGLGLMIWCQRTLGMIPGIWMALLVMGFLPLRLVGISYASQAIGLVLYVWGCCLIFSKPWSKTASLESAIGGFFLGAAAFTTPWSWLYALAIPFRAVYSKPFRSRLQRGFWWGLLSGLIPGIFWLIQSKEWDLIDVGIHLETLLPGKILTVYYLIRDGWGIPMFLLALLGIRTAWSMKASQLSWWVDLSWPLPVAFVLGYGDPMTHSLATPALLFLVVLGIQKIGKIFVNRTEQVVLPTFLVFILVYHTFFSGLREVRDWQVYSRENKGLVDLVREAVPPSLPLALFSKSSLIPLVNPEQPAGYLDRMLPTAFFDCRIDELIPHLSQKIDGQGSVWMAPRQFKEVFAPRGEAILSRLCQEFICREVPGQDQAVLLELKSKESR